jgi:hemin uptake protein HemP
VPLDDIPASASQIASQREFNVSCWSGRLNSPIIPSQAPRQDTQPNSTPIDSTSLFQGRQEVVIFHDGHEYRLRITRQNKLILTK